MFVPALRRPAALLLFLLLPLLLAGCNTDKKRASLKIGYMVCNSEEETKERFIPLTKFLSEKTGIDFVMEPVDTQDVEKRFKNGEFALVHSNSLIYVILKERYALELLAAEKRGQFGSRSAGTLIARAGSGIKTIQDIRGKKLAFGPMLAPTGYLAVYHLLQSAGLDPEKDLGYYAIPGGSYKHEKAIYSVIYGAFDVAAAPALDLEVLAREGRISPDQFVVLGQSPLIPYCTFGAAKGTDPEVVQKVRQALLDLKPSDTVEIDGERVKVLKAAGIDGYEQLLDSDYNPLREMARKANMPPYQTY